MSLLEKCFAKNLWFDQGSGQEADDANEVNDNDDEDDYDEDEDNEDKDKDEDVNLVGGWEFWAAGGGCGELGKETAGLYLQYEDAERWRWLWMWWWCWWW